VERLLLLPAPGREVTFLTFMVLILMAQCPDCHKFEVKVAAPARVGRPPQASWCQRYREGPRRKGARDAARVQVKVMRRRAQKVTTD